MSSPDALPFLPWWTLAAALGALTVAFWLALRRPLGVSGMLGNLLAPRAALARERAERAAPLEALELEAALLAATREAFGDAALAAGASAPPPAIAPAGRGLGPSLPVAGQALFLVGIAAGALLARLLRGAPLDPSLGPEFARLFGTGPRALAALAAGGFLVGFGACLAGGCSTGHGLSGCARLQPASVAATASFLAAAVAVSLTLGWAS